MNKMTTYLLLGMENGLKSEYLVKIKEKARKDALSLESHRYYGYEMDVARVMALLQSPSLFGDVPWIEIAMSESLKKNELKSLVALLKKGLGSGYLIFLSDEEKIDKSLDVLTPVNHKKVFKPLTEEALVHYIGEYLKSEDFIMEESAMLLLLSRLENDSQSIQRMLRFLIQTVPEAAAKEITLAMVQEYVDQRKEVSVHDLFATIARRDLEASLNIAEQLFNSKEGLNVMTLIVLNRSFKGVIDYKALRAKGYSSVQALKELKIFYQRAESTKLADQHFKDEELTLIMAGSLAYDLAARDGNKELVKQVVLQYIMSCCSEYFCVYE